MKQYQCLFCIILLFFCNVSLLSQTKTIDRLKNNIERAASQEEKQRAIFAFCELGNILHPDTLMAYAEKARVTAAGQNNLHDAVWAMFYKSCALTTKGLIDSSLSLANQCLDILSRQVDDPVLQTSIFNQKGRCFMRKNQYKEAIDMGYRTITSAEKAKEMLLQVKGKTLIGWAYLEMGQLQTALAWHLSALNTTQDSLLLEKYAILFANLALNYSSIGKQDSGFFYIVKAIANARKHENLFALSNSLAIEAQLFVRSGKASLAEAPLKEVIEIRKLIGDPFYIVSDIGQLGLYYAQNGQPEKGIAICKEGIAMAREYKIDSKLFFLYNSLANNYKAKGDVKEYAKTLEDIIKIRDSVYQKNSAVALAEMQTKYEVQKKEFTIVQQKLDLVTKNYWLYGAALVSLFAVLIFYLLFQNYRKRQKIKMNQLLFEEKILAGKSVKEAEEKERKRIAADLHDNLGAYAASIVANLDNITLQKSDTENVTALRELRSNSQSIVSQLGDTIWALKKEELLLTAISDRLKVLIQKIGPSYPTIKIDVIETISDDILLPPSQAFHLYQTIQEALINALRHSNCKQVRVLFESDRNWKISICDNGKGILNPGKKNLEGNGMANMKNRCKEMGWSIEWVINEFNGTRVIISPFLN
ncbi:MAG: ATP-binding protein [Ferruginibacter sp.]